MIDSIWLLVTGVIGLALGGLAGYLIFGRNGATAQNANAVKELEDYKEKVTDHFAETAKLVNRMTDSYKEVFEQLQQGANQLLDQEQLKARLADESQEAITLSKIGFKPVESAPSEEPESTEKKPEEPATEAKPSEPVVQPTDYVQESTEEPTETTEEPSPASK